MAQSAAGLAVKSFVGDLLGGIVLFPVWWYTRGLATMADWTSHSFSTANRSLGWSLWAKNLFVPMYGETDWTGKLVSFGVRFAMIVVRGIGVLAWSAGAGLAFGAYLVALPLAVVGLLYHGAGMFIG